MEQQRTTKTGMMKTGERKEKRGNIHSVGNGEGEKKEEKWEEEK